MKKLSLEDCKIRDEGAIAIIARDVQDDVTHTLVPSASCSMWTYTAERQTCLSATHATAAVTVMQMMIQGSDNILLIYPLVYRERAMRVRVYRET